MPLTRDEAIAIAELVCVVRPSWDRRGVFTRGLMPLAKHPAPLEVIVWAAIRAARDPENRTPAVIPLNGHHWNLADRPETPRLTPEHECRDHPGKWAGNCPLCRADQLADPTNDQREPEDDGLSHMPARERAREAARRAKHALEVHDDDQEDDQPRRRYSPRVIAVLEHLGAHLRYGTPEHTAHHHRLHPHRRGMPADERRRSAAFDYRHGLTPWTQPERTTTP